MSTFITSARQILEDEIKRKESLIAEIKGIFPHLVIEDIDDVLDALWLLKVNVFGPPR